MRNNEINAELKKDKYFQQGVCYYVDFKYDSENQKDRIYDAFKNGLISEFGVNSPRFNENKNCILPYYVDSNGDFSADDTGIIGGTNIPEELLEAFIKRFVEHDKVDVKIGGEIIKSDNFDLERVSSLIKTLDNNKKR